MCITPGSAGVGVLDVFLCFAFTLNLEIKLAYTVSVASRDMAL